MKKPVSLDCYFFGTAESSSMGSLGLGVGLVSSGDGLGDGSSGLGDGVGDGDGDGSTLEDESSGFIDGSGFSQPTHL